MKCLLLVLGLAIAAGAEAHADTGKMVVQGLIGVIMVWFALRRGGRNANRM